LVKDGYLVTEEKSWLVAQGPSGPFCYSTNVNLGLSLVDKDADVLLMGDDVRFKSVDTIERLYAQAYLDPTIGILSPRIIGGADNPLLTDPPQEQDVVYTERYIPLVCAYLKRRMLSQVGQLDAENFSKGWGWDDVDLSRRVRLAGFTLGVATRIEVIHGVKRRGSESLIRNEKGDHDALQKLDNINAQEFFKKWGDNVK
jgi:GT2 family glycosyltransferase